MAKNEKKENQQALSFEQAIERLNQIVGRIEQGQIPLAESLERLVEDGYITSVPLDPYSDKPLIYKRVGDDFVLYSVGTDFEDDGGTAGKDNQGRVKMWDTNGDAVFWPVQP